MSDYQAFKAAHLFSLLDQPSNAYLEEWFKSGLVYELEKQDSISFVVDDKVQMCGGVRPYWPGRGQIWTVFSEHTMENFVPSFRAIKRWLKYQISTNYSRLELSVDYNVTQGKRRAEMLGFTLEVERARKFLPNGEDCTLYSMVRD